MRGDVPLYLFVPLPPSADMSSRTVVVDDSDTDTIKYIDGAQSGPSQGGGWSPYTGASLNENFEGPIHNSTLHAATFTGTSLELAFSGASASCLCTQHGLTDFDVCRCLSAYTT